MAEAVQLPSMPTRYFCYQCDREVSLMPSAQLICPDCSTGFLEEVSDGLSFNYLTSDSGEESEVDESELNFLNLLSIENLFRRAVLHAVDDGQDSADDGPESPRSNTQNESSDRDGLEPVIRDGLEPVIQVLSSRNFLQDMQENLFRGRSTGLRHIGDYLFGDDIDALSTMLLNDTEIAGPPPLPKDQIKSLPIVSISKEDVDKRIQCTICMEDFMIKEKAKCLPCSHMYHEKCIVPWLERHSTCPNCRKLVEVTQRKRSQSCPRSEYSLSRNQDQRRASESTSGFFRSRNPFRFI